MIAEDFKKCDICGAEIELKPDSPLYCSSCIEQMEKKSLTPEQYKQFRELKQTIKD